MTASTQQQLGQRSAPNPYWALQETGNRPPPEHQQLRGALRKQVADYLEAVRDREQLPPHAFPGGVFFMDAFPAYEIAERARGRSAGLAPLEPVAPIGQRTWLEDDDEDDDHAFSLQMLPDLGRRVQLWWDELAPGHGPLRADEAVRFVRRVEWLGRVEDVGEERFTATLWDRAQPGSVERAEFFLAQLGAHDRERIVPGARLYWTVGYVENAVRERTAASRVRLRRGLGRRTPELRREATDRADAVVRALFDVPFDPPDE